MRAKRAGCATVNDATEALRPVLLATSGDDDDVAAARVAAVDVAGRSSAPLHLLVVWQASTAPGSLPAAVLASGAAAKLEDEVRAVVDIGGRVSGSHLRRGFRARHILAVAGELRARLIVTGAHGGGAFFRFLHDSVSEAVIRGSGFPVLVIRSGPPAWPPRHVVIGDNASKDSDRVVVAGGWFAGFLGVPVRLVAVRGGNNPPLSDSVIARHARTIAEMAGDAPDVLTPDGDPVDRILAAAAEERHARCRRPSMARAHRGVGEAGLDQPAPRAPGTVSHRAPAAFRSAPRLTACGWCASSRSAGSRAVSVGDTWHMRR